MDEDKTVPRAILTEILLDTLDKAVRQHRDDKSHQITEEIRDRGYAKAEVLQRFRNFPICRLPRLRWSPN